jgi:hypothetical protein
VHRRRFLLLAAVALAAVVIGGYGTPAARIGARIGASQLYERLPMSFVPNAGQLDQGVRFESRGAGKDVLLMGDSVVLAFGAAH